MSRLYTLLLLLACSMTVSGDETKDPLKQVERELEEWRLSILKEVQDNPHNTLSTFTTDGCSGGMSDGWHFMARTIPVFGEKFGDRPPWEACCVEHDRAYWSGAVADGYEKRMTADQTLRQCVIDYGRTHADEFGREFSLGRQVIEKNFQITADLMYQAVRVGGQPCTMFPWRWGYGWPMCHNQLLEKLSDKVMN